MSNKRELLNEWFKYGDRDLHSAEIIFSQAPEYFDMIGFHCQQAVEKYLKGYLTFLEIDFPKTHNLPLLMDLINEVSEFPEPYYKKAADLSSFAVETRYPFSKPVFSEIDQSNRILIVKEFKEEIILRTK